MGVWYTPQEWFKKFCRKMANDGIPIDAFPKVCCSNTEEPKEMLDLPKQEVKNGEAD